MDLYSQIRRLFSPRDMLFTSLGLLFCVLVTFLNLSITSENQFSVLSAQWLKGVLYLPAAVGDAVLYNGHYYWHLGPFPVMFLVPMSLITLSIFGQPIPQGVVNIILTFGVWCLSYLITKSHGFSTTSSRWLSFGLVFSSVFFLSALLPWSWHFSQTVTLFFGLLALHEYGGKRNHLLIGLYHSFIFMTRFTAGFGVLFYFGSILFN